MDELEGMPFGLPGLQTVHGSDVKVTVAQLANQPLGQIAFDRVFEIHFWLMPPHASGLGPGVIRSGRFTRRVADGGAIKNGHGRVVAGTKKLGLVIAHDQQHVQASRHDAFVQGIHRDLAGIKAFAHLLGRDHGLGARWHPC